MLPGAEESKEIWEAMIADVFFSPAGTRMLNTLTEVCASQSEFNFLSIDCTFRLMFALRGQVSYRAPAAVRRKQAFTETDAQHALLTVRGFRCSVLCLKTLHFKKAELGGTEDKREKPRSV